MHVTEAMLSAFKRRYERLTQGVLRRGFATHQQGWGGSHHQGRRPPPTPPAPPPTPPEKIEWWAVDGELFKAEKFDPKRVLAPLGNDHIPNRRRRKERIKHLGQTRLKLRVHGQESYWAAYMKRFQAMRDEWERHVWDPIPVPLRKPRNPAWVAEESEKYVWKDPRRDAYTYDVSRMDHSASRSRFDNKIGYKVQGMNRYPVEGRSDPGGSSIRSGITPMRRDSYKDSRSYESAYKDQRYGHQRSTDIGRRNSRQFEYDNFEDVFDDRNTTISGGNATENRALSARHRKQASLSTQDDEDDSDGLEFNWDESDSEEADGDDDDVDDRDEDVSESRTQSQSPQRRARYATRSGGNATENRAQSARHRQQASLSTEDDEDDSDGLEFNWDESDSEEADGDDDDDDVDDRDEDVSETRTQSQSPQRRAWYGNEDDLFKDDD